MIGEYVAEPLRRAKPTFSAIMAQTNAGAEDRVWRELRARFWPRLDLLTVPLEWEVRTR